MFAQDNDYTETKMTLSKFLWINLGCEFSINAQECSIEKKAVRTPSGYVTIFSCYDYSFIFESEKPFLLIGANEIEVQDVFGQIYTLRAKEPTIV